MLIEVKCVCVFIEVSAHICVCIVVLKKII
jgi:hypothetical protein